MTAEFKKYIDERFDRLEAVTLIGAKPILTAEEAAAYTGYSLKVIYYLTSNRKIPHYKKNGKLYFRKEELDVWMTETRIRTDSELERDATTYTALH